MTCITRPGIQQHRGFLGSELRTQDAPITRTLNHSVSCRRCPFEKGLRRVHVDQGHRPETHYVYVACCANGALYVGYTTHVERRMAAHNVGRGGRYTRANLPIALVAAWSFTSKIGRA